MISFGGSDRHLSTPLSTSSYHYQNNLLYITKLTSRKCPYVVHALFMVIETDGTIFIGKKINHEKCYPFDHAIHVVCFGTRYYRRARNTNREEIPTDGDWDEGFKSSYWSSRIEINFTGSVLTISSKTLRSDITIRISQNDEAIFEQTVPAPETERITIDLSNLEAGSCFLELTNQWGDYLYGYFYLE